MTFEHSIEIKTYDIDFAGIVSNIVYVRWLEDMRIGILAPYYGMQEMVADGISPILLETSIQYRRALRYGESVSGRMAITELSGVRWRLEAEFTVGEETAATAEQSGIFVSLATGKPIRVPGRLRDAYESVAANPSRKQGAEQ